MSCLFWSSLRILGPRAVCLSLLLIVAGCGGGGGAPDEITQFQEIMTTISTGDKQAGRQQLDAFLEDHPNSLAYSARAKLRMEEKDVPGAIADCEKGLQLNPGDREMTWMMTELKKPEGQRFKGAAAQSPRANK